MLQSPCNKVAHKKFQFIFFNEAIWSKYWEDDVGLSGLALQINSSNCLALIETNGDYLFAIGGTMA